MITFPSRWSRWSWKKKWLFCPLNWKQVKMQLELSVSCMCSGRWLLQAELCQSNCTLQQRPPVSFMTSGSSNATKSQASFLALQEKWFWRTQPWSSTHSSWRKKITKPWMFPSRLIYLWHAGYSGTCCKLMWRACGQLQLLPGGLNGAAGSCTMIGRNGWVENYTSFCILVCAEHMKCLSCVRWRWDGLLKADDMAATGITNVCSTQKIKDFWRSDEHSIREQLEE